MVSEQQHIMTQTTEEVQLTELELVKLEGYGPLSAWEVVSTPTWKNAFKEQKKAKE